MPDREIFGGLAFTLIGTATWVWHVPRPQRFFAAFGFALAGVLLYLLPLNVHGMTGYGLFVLFGTWVTAIVLALIGIFRK